MTYEHITGMTRQKSSQSDRHSYPHCPLVGKVGDIVTSSSVRQSVRPFVCNNFAVGIRALGAVLFKLVLCKLTTNHAIHCLRNVILIVLEYD